VGHSGDHGEYTTLRLITCANHSFASELFALEFFATQTGSQRLRTNAAGKMIVMEGMMLVPPERGTIIGRAMWKVGLFQSPCGSLF